MHLSGEIFVAQKQETAAVAKVEALVQRQSAAVSAASSTVGSPLLITSSSSAGGAGRRMSVHSNDSSLPFLKQYGQISGQRLDGTSAADRHAAEKARDAAQQIVMQAKRERDLMAAQEQLLQTLFVQKTHFTKTELADRMKITVRRDLLAMEVEEFRRRSDLKKVNNRFWGRVDIDVRLQGLQTEERRIRKLLYVTLVVEGPELIARVAILRHEDAARQLLVRLLIAETTRVQLQRWESVLEERYDSPFRILNEMTQERKSVFALMHMLDKVQQQQDRDAGYGGDDPLLFPPEDQQQGSGRITSLARQSTPTKRVHVRSPMKALIANASKLNETAVANSASTRLNNDEFLKKVRHAVAEAAVKKQFLAPAPRAKWRA